MTNPYHAVTQHTIQRIQERYGMNCDEDDYDFLCDRIKKGWAILVTRSDPTRDVYYVSYLGRTVRVVWDNTIDRIVTALPLRH